MFQFDSFQERNTKHKIMRSVGNRTQEPWRINPDKPMDSQIHKRHQSL